MWKRFNRPKDQQIGYPTLFETTYDERYLETIPEVKSLRSSQGTIVAAPTAETLFQAAHHQSPPRHSTDDGRSFSLYSQPSPDLHNNAARETNQSSAATYADVSPPDSLQDSDDESRPGSPDVSPIEEEHSPVEGKSRGPDQVPNPERAFRSHLPVLRKVAPGADSTITKFGKSPGWRRAPPEAAERGSATTKWDDFSGEPTDHADGKQASVQPGNQPFQRQEDWQEERYRKSLAKKPPRLQLDPLDHPVRREPWKGPSGRTTLVSPVKNDPSARLDPLQVPKNRNKKPDPNAEVATEPSPATPNTVKGILSEPIDEIIRPVVPLKLGANSPRVRSPVTAENMQGFPRGLSNPQLVTAPSTPTTLRPEDVQNTKLEHVTPTTPGQESPTLGTQDPLKIQELPHYSELTPPQRSPSSPLKPPLPDTPEHPLTASHENHPSRDFSWTTFATTGTESPPMTPGRTDDVVPAPPVSTMPSPLVMRKRPVPSRLEPTPVYKAITHAVVRKPTPLQQPRTSSLFTTASNLGKALPQCPPEIEAADKIAALEARLEDLRHRKRNINQITKELSSVIHPASMAYDLAAREEFKRTLASLKDELADIGQEEHDVGLRLHRAHKKRDKEALYENPTGLWIKRVTT